MFNATRVRYTEKPLYKYYQHDGSISHMKRQGEANLNYQRHYIKITRLLDELNHSYANRIPIYPEFKQQVIYEGLRVCHCIRKEPDPQIRQRMIAEVFVSGMFKRMVCNIRSVKLGYQVLLWALRFSKWRDKSLTPRRLSRLTLELND